jgi:Cu2+-exporting ATPase
MKPEGAHDHTGGAHSGHAAHVMPSGQNKSAGHDQHAGHAHTEQAAPTMHAGHDGHATHDKHAGHSPAMFRDKFWLCLILTIPALTWGHMLQGALGYTAPAFPGSRWIPALFGATVFAIGGWPFVQGAVRELRDRRPGMMTLIALAITVAFVFSAAVTFGYPGMPLWEELATLVTIMLLGHWMEMRSITQAQGALKELARLLPDTAARIVGGRIEEVKLSEIREGDLVLVRPGSRVPTDGVVREGRSAVDESMITGESRPVTKAENQEVIAGTVNGEGSLRVEVTRTGDRTALAGIMRLVEQAQTSKSRAQDLADRAALLLTIIAVASAVVTGIVWLALGAEGSYVVERVVTVLVIACPHALGLAVPLVIAISTTLGARNGLLVRNRRGLEDARNLDAVVFDKTGTLTLGEHRVVAMWTTGTTDEAEALRLAAAVEADAEHPVARAIVRTAEGRGIGVPPSTAFMAIAGHGVQAHVEGRELAVGGPNLLGKLGIELPDAVRVFTDESASSGHGVVYLVEGTNVLAAFAVADAIRPESAEAVRRLHDLGLEVVMLTGDARPVATWVAKELGIDTVYAEVLPDEKVSHVMALEKAGKRTAMVGDGINDAPALASATVGIAVGAGTDVAVEAGDVVLVRSDPRDVPRIIALSAATYRKMVQNLWLAAGYNVIAIPLAAGVLAGRGIVLSPAIGAVLMSLSTIVVALNAQLLRRVSLAATGAGAERPPT